MATTCVVELLVRATVPGPVAAAPTSHLLLSSLKVAATGDEFEEPLDPVEHVPLTATKDDDEDEGADGDQ